LSESPFEKIDGMSLRVGPFDLAYALSNVAAVRRNIGVLVALSVAFWVGLGWDSTWEQLNPILENPWPLLSPGSEAYEALMFQVRGFYGMGDHWSAPVIYGLAFIALSLHLERVGVVKSMNFFVTTAMSLASIGVFEFVYNRLYSIYQQQWWTFSFAWPNARNILFFTGFVLVGVLAYVVLHDFGYRVRWTWWKVALIPLSVGLWLLWLFYPFPTQPLTVMTEWGLWTSGPLFPQTFYAVDVFNDGKAFGAPFWVQNDALHLLNTLTKAVTSATILGICMVEKRHA
jgi:hypothetical protein